MSHIRTKVHLLILLVMLHHAVGARDRTGENITIAMEHENDVHVKEKVTTIRLHQTEEEDEVFKPSSVKENRGNASNYGCCGRNEFQCVGGYDDNGRRWYFDGFCYNPCPGGCNVYQCAGGCGSCSKRDACTGY
eukprot:gnl/TRDRNA2_/TRDRNA2_187215_c0_seq1.p2 gnl/TRDRNA2_/TRDRNA2_187215_c0~~gnl/TRDRNA2_/TRDRNA2_187215_c0_seq1.p2  ORF type:complete len:134 (+),score=9.84 gnl/TRDRNA2_/TRDRNA2_187215_c0_seq1:88-489(+)